MRFPSQCVTVCDLHERSQLISYVKNYTTISDRDIDIIMHCRKSLLFDNEIPWNKRNHSNMFDVTLVSFNGAEVCELVGLFLLDNLSDKYGKNNVGLYRDDGLVLLRGCLHGKTCTGASFTPR